VHVIQILAPPLLWLWQYNLSVMTSYGYSYMTTECLYPINFNKYTGSFLFKRDKISTYLRSDVLSVLKCYTF